MESLHIDTGTVRLCINDDPGRVISFSPTDVAFAERFYALIGTFEEKEQEYKAREEALKENKELDAYGAPKNAGERLKLLHDECSFVRQKIDDVFGAGTSETVFGSANTLDMFEQFFSGITPYIRKARDKKVQKYTAKPAKRGVLK